MPKLEIVIRDLKGDVIPQAQVTVFDANSFNAVDLFEDFAQTIPEDNPLVVGDDGVFKAYLDAGRYDVLIARTGILTITLEDEEVVSAP